MNYRVFVDIAEPLAYRPLTKLAYNWQCVGDGVDFITREAVSAWDFAVRAERVEAFLDAVAKCPAVQRCHELAGCAELDDEAEELWRPDHPNFIHRNAEGPRYRWRTLDGRIVEAAVWPGIDYEPAYDHRRTQPYPGVDQWERWANYLLGIRSTGRRSA